MALLLVLLGLVAPAASHGAWPGANGRIVFWDDRSQSTYGIYSMNQDGTDVRRLIDIGNAASDPEPAWSPDGSKIAFAGNDHEIYFMNADGSGVTRVTNTGGNAVQPSWSPNGGKLLFTSGGSIHVINTDGTGDTDLGTGNSAGSIGGSNPVWSPDSSRIAFEGNDFGGHIFVMNADGTDAVRLTRDPDPRVGEVTPDWSPDSSKLIFWKRLPSGPPHELVEAINADGSGQSFVTEGVRPAWSPDGTRIVFGRDGSVFTANADGTGEANIGPGFAPDWQPVPSRPPDCSEVTATPNVLFPANRKLVEVALAGATDTEGDAVTLTVDRVTQDEPVTGNGDPTSPDAASGGAPNTVSLRAERNPQGDGRAYRVGFTASNSRGGSCSGTVIVAVPRHTHAPAIDSAPPSFDSFGS